jgi:hypothetical protein
VASQYPQMKPRSDRFLKGTTLENLSMVCRFSLCLNLMLLVWEVHVRFSE